MSIKSTRAHNSSKSQASVIGTRYLLSLLSFFWAATPRKKNRIVSKPTMAFLDDKSHPSWCKGAQVEARLRRVGSDLKKWRNLSRYAMLKCSPSCWTCSRNSYSARVDERDSMTGARWNLCVSQKMFNTESDLYKTALNFRDFCQCAISS